MIVIILVILLIIIIISYFLIIIAYLSKDKSNNSSDGIYSTYLTPCSVSNDCDSGQICDPFSSVCKLSDGSLCNTASECENGYIRSGVCVASGDNGNLNGKCPCNDNLTCNRDYTINICKITPNNPCSENYECDSYNCISNICSAYVKNGYSCSRVNPCESNNCSNGYCQDENITTGTIGSTCVSSSCAEDNRNGATCNPDLQCTCTDEFSSRCMSISQLGQGCNINQNISCNNYFICADSNLNNQECIGSSCSCMYNPLNPNIVTISSICDQTSVLIDENSEYRCVSTSSFSCNNNNDCYNSSCNQQPLLLYYIIGLSILSPDLTNSISYGNITGFNNGFYQNISINNNPYIMISNDYILIYNINNDVAYYQLNGTVNDISVSNMSISKVQDSTPSGNTIHLSHYKLSNYLIEFQTTKPSTVLDYVFSTLITSNNTGFIIGILQDNIGYMMTYISIIDNNAQINIVNYGLQDYMTDQNNNVLTNITNIQSMSYTGTSQSIIVGTDDEIYIYDIGIIRGNTIIINNIVKLNIADFDGFIIRIDNFNNNIFYTSSNEIKSIDVNSNLILIYTIDSRYQLLDFSCYNSMIIAKVERNGVMMNMVIDYTNSSFIIPGYVNNNTTIASQYGYLMLGGYACS